jgi:hypothetical protein
MKFDWKSYFAPTPKLAMQIGLACKAVAGMSVPATYMGNTKVAMVLFGVGIAGELLSNFFVEKEEK